MNQKIGIGIFWNLASLLMTRGASTVFTLFLARLLVPEAFGLIAMATIVFELANAFVNSGLSTALIRSKTVSNIDLNTVFYTNLILSIVAYSLIFLSASYVADFYNQPDLILLIQVTGLVVLINAANIVQSAIFSRKMNFKSLTKINVLSVVVSGFLAVTAAWYGFGVWSLVVQMLSSTLISTILLWFMSSWRPALELSVESFTKLFGFSKSLLVEGLLDIIFRNSYILVIGRFFSAEVTGLYFFAKKLSDLIAQQLTGAIQAATFPALSTMQDENEALKYKYRQIMQLTLFVIAPIMALLAGLSPVLIPLAFKESWNPAIPYLQLLCILGALWPLHAINVNLLMVKGHSGLLLKIGLIKRTVGMALLFFAIPYGVLGIIVGQIISSFLALIPNTYFSAQLIGYTLSSQSKDAIKPLLCALISGLCAWFFIQQAENYLFIWLISGGLVGLSIYLVLCYTIRVEGMTLLITKFAKYIPLNRFSK